MYYVTQPCTNYAMAKKKEACEKEPPCSVTDAAKTMEAVKPKTKFTTKLYFWLFIMLAIAAAFLFWSARGQSFTSETSPVGVNVSVFGAIIATVLAIFFALICFIRFLRTRSIVGGLFLTTAISTAIFLGTSQVIQMVIPVQAAAFSGAPEAAGTGIEVIIGLAQIGLFALWFLFLLLTIYIHIKPVKRIDKYLSRLAEGEHIKKFRIGKGKQYRIIEERLKTLAEKIEKNHKT